MWAILKGSWGVLEEDMAYGTKLVVYVVLKGGLRVEISDISLGIGFRLRVTCTWLSPGWLLGRQFFGFL